MSGIADHDDDELVRTRTAQLVIAEADLGLTIRASRAPDGSPGVDAGELPRITLDGRAGGSPPPETARRADLAVVKTLGEGGMGRVHLARQRSLAREVAVKTLKEGASPAVAGALLREARLTGMLEHPGVIPVHALGVDELGRPMLIMKRVDGVDLGDKLEDRPQTGDGLLTYLEALMQVCRTCEFAHSRGVIHRDIKPENIMVGGFGEVYLLDWGIATTIDPQSPRNEPIVGTPVYMAPEMVGGRSVDARTDVYLLGATLHEILTGRPRHVGKSMVEVARAAWLSAPYVYEPEVPDELARLCNRATARDPAQRPESAAAFREEIATFLRQRAAHAIADAAASRLAELEGMLAEGLAEEEEAPRDLARAYRLLAEARFGLAQSLEQAPGDVETRAAMHRCALAAVELELRQDHIESAEALLRELVDPDITLAARIDDRRARRAAQTKERERLERIDRELDPTHKAHGRSIPVAILALVVLVIGTYYGRFSELTPESLVGVAAVVFVCVLVGLVVAWRTLMTNEFNRRSALLFLLIIGSVMTNRLFGLAARRAPVETIAFDLLLVFALVSAAAITLVSNLWPCALVLGAGLLGLHAWPEHTGPIFTAANVANLALAAWLLSRARRR